MELEEYSKENEMRINNNKLTKLMVFNTARKRDFIPRFDIEGIPIEVVEKT